MFEKIQQIKMFKDMRTDKIMKRNILSLNFITVIKDPSQCEIDIACQGIGLPVAEPRVLVWSVVQ